MIKPFIQLYKNVIASAPYMLNAMPNTAAAFSQNLSSFLSDKHTYISAGGSISHV